MLKSIYIKGFKSFCNPVILDINAPIIVFIGPNGCGKSNIFDAFLWILAEQSIKKLRGDNAQDLIFSGTKKKPASNFAEVTLEIDSSHISDIEEIPLNITRRIFRNETSQFLLNDKSTRLFYIKEKLGEYNLNISPFSFISQGNVENLLNKKPSELREIFEDIAGIYKYKKIIQNYKQSIEQKYFEFNVLKEKKEQILSRLESLRSQSEKAIKYQQIYSEKQNLYKESLILKFRRYFEKVTKHKTAKIQLDMDYKESNAQHEILNSKKLGIARDLDNIIQKIRIIDKDYSNRSKKDIELKSNKNVLNEKIDLNEKEIKRLENEIVKSEKQNEELKYKLQIDRDKILALNKKTDDIHVQSSQLNEKKNALESILNSGENEARALNSKILKLSEEVSEGMDLINAREKELIEFQGILKNRKELKNKLESRLDQLNREKNSLQGQIEENTPVLEGIQKEIENLTRKINKENEIYSKLSRKLQEIREEKISVQSKLETLKSIERKDRSEPLNLKGLKGYLGVFYDIFEFNESCINYIDPFLESLSEALVFNDNRTMTEFINSYTDRNSPSVCVTSLELLEKSKGTAVLYNKNKYFIPIKLKKDFSPEDHENYANEKLLLKSPFIICNPLNWPHKSTVLHKFNIRKHERRISELNEDERQAEKNAKKIDIILAGLDKEIHIQKSSLEECNHKISSSNTGIKSLRSSISELRDELKANEREIKISEEEIKKISESTAKIHDQLNDTSSELKILREEYDNRNLELETLRIELNNHKGKLQKNEYTLRNLDNETGFLKKSISATEDSLTNNMLNLEAIEERISQIHDLLSSFREQLIFFHNEQVLIQKKISETAEEKKQQIKIRNSIQKDLDNIDRLIQQQKEKTSGIHESIHKIDIALEKDKTMLEITKSEFLEHYNDEDILYSYDLDIKVNDAALEGYKSRLKNMDQELSDIGDINPLAIKEYEKENERYKEYLLQMEDIQSAIEELDSLISKTNREALDRYYNTIYSIEENFKKIFGKLFNGGNAQINLLDTEASDEELPIPCPDIIINPPGKNINKINLLSGGEKALSALALIFSLFLYKPSPFCFLDEVDASLDEINTVKFIELVKEFSMNTQFFIITHNRKTMSIGDFIYGITSEEKGISKVLSISFENE